jgi:hypothetical protein
MGSYERLGDNFQAIQKLGDAITLSQMFGCTNKEQGLVIATELYITGQSPIEYQRRNKIVSGKPFKQYDTMLAEFHERGGKSRILSKTPELASIELIYNDDKQTFSLSWEDAKNEVFPYSGKEAEIVDLISKGTAPKLKPKYATARSRAIMLFARVVSDAIRSMCPEVNFGVYTAEEMDATDDSDSRDESPSPGRSAPVQPPAKKEEEVTTKLMASEEGETESPIDSPLSTALYETLVTEIDIAARNDPDFKKKLKTRLVACGLKGLKDLTNQEGEALLDNLTKRNVSAVFDASFKGFKPVNPT